MQFFPQFIFHFAKKKKENIISHPSYRRKIKQIMLNQNKYNTNQHVLDAMIKYIAFLMK